MTGWHIGVLGGSGLYELDGLDEAQQISVASSFGEPSGPVTMGAIEGVRFTFLARHGTDHRLPPSAINYRANIDVLKRCGVTDVLSVSAIGSLREDIAPGHFMMPDQFLDRTEGRARSFFDTGVTAHVDLADPICPRLSAFVASAAATSGAPVQSGGCYVAIEGPQFSTRAESELYRQWGADVIGMTAMPEARLAREAELPYALLGLVTDYDCWRSGDAVQATDILSVMRDNLAKARATLVELARSLPREREPSPIDHALEAAIVTPPDRWDQRLVRRLDAVAAGYLRRRTGG